MRERRTFWIGLCLAVGLLGTIVHFASRFAVGQAVRPSFPWPGSAYISSITAGETDHALFYFGLFGFGERIRRADVVVIGSSHAMCGIDAMQIAESLSPPGQKLRAFNAAVGYGEGLSFETIILKRFTPAERYTFFDTFSSDAGLSSQARMVMRLKLREAYLQVLNVWSSFVGGWLVQGLLPKLTLDPKAGATLSHPLGLAVIRDWQTGDVREVWNPYGEVFAQESASHAMLNGPDWPGVAPADSDIEYLRSRGHDMIATIVPYPSYTQDASRAISAKLSARFAPLSGEGLTFWDYHHLTSQSREKATREILRALR